MEDPHQNQDENHRLNCFHCFMKSGDDIEKWEKMWNDKVERRKKSLEGLENTGSFVDRKTAISSEKFCLIHDNGGRPFKIEVNDTGMKIYTFEDMEETSDYDKFEFKGESDDTYQNNDEVQVQNNDEVQVQNNDEVQVQNNDEVQVQNNDEVQNNEEVQVQNNDEVQVQNVLGGLKPINIFKHYNVLLYHFPDFVGYWYGFDSSAYVMHGNSVLINLESDEYVYVGCQIFKFKAIDKIIDYISPVGNSDVPYPVAYGENGVYFLKEYIYIDNTHLKLKSTVANADDMYTELYTRSNELKPHVQKLKFEKLADRRW